MRVIRVVPVLGVVALLLYAGVGAQPLPWADGANDKLAHLLGFAAFGCALRAAFPRLPLGGFVAVCVALVAAIELAQMLQPQRTPSLGDVAAGLLGAGLGWLAVQVWRRRRGARG